MPSYNKISRSIRIQFKGRIREFLVSKLGEQGADKCIIIRKVEKESATTLGIPANLEQSFKKVAVSFLRQKFGAEQVPFQIWELSLSLNIDEAFGSQCGLIMSLIREVTESLRRFIRMRNIVQNDLSNILSKISKRKSDQSTILNDTAKKTKTDVTVVDDDKLENKEILAFEKNTAANKDKEIIEERENDDDLIIINTATPKSINCVSFYILKIDENFQ